MNRSLVAAFVLRLQDRASAGIGALQRRLQGLSQVGRRIALIGGIGAGLTFAGPITQTAALEQQMRQTAITAGLSGAAVDEMMTRSMALFQEAARGTNIRVRDLAAAAGTLVAGGGRAGEVWEELVPIIARVATASGANANDLSQTVLAMVNNLELAPNQVESALAGLVQAGKEGQFELRDMAREFASLTAAAAGIGLRGPQAVASLAAALQVARQGAGTAGEAATNLQNILQKMTSPDAQRNFETMGVKIEDVLADAARRGINPFEAVIQKIREITGGNMFRVGELFQDQQVLAFLRPMLQQTQRYIDIRDRAAAAGPELIRTDQITAMQGLSAELQRVNVAMDELMTLLGMSVAGPVRTFGDGISWLAERVRELDAAHPGLARRIGWVLGLVAGFTAAAGALGFVLGPIAAGFAALSGPVGIAIGLMAAVGLAAWWIYDNWEGVSDWFGQQWRSMSGWATTEWARIRDADQTAWIMRRFADLEGLFTSFVGSSWGRQLLGSISFDWENAPLKRFIDWIDGKLESLREWTRLAPSFAGLQGAPAAIGNVQQRQAAGAAGRAAGFYAPGELAGAAGAGAGGTPPVAQIGGVIEVRGAPGTEVVSTESTNPRVPITTSGDRGATRGRP